MAADPPNSGPNPGPRQPDSQPIFDAEQQARLQELSRKLLDLWQDHVSALAQDPSLMAQALKLMTAAAPFAWLPGYPMQGFGAGFGMPAATEGGAGFAQPASPFPFQWPSPGGASTAPAGPAAAAAASGPGAGDVEQLRARLAELEGRLASLEGGGARPSAARPAAARPRKPKRGPAGG